MQYEKYASHLRKIADIRYAAALLQWDQETYMPPASAQSRGSQIATLTTLAHELFTSEETGNMIETLLQKDDLTATEKQNLVCSHEDFNRQTKLPSAFVHEMSETVNKSFHAWIKARKENKFDVFEPDLQKIIQLKIREADYIGFKAHPYDALMNDYDRGLTVAETDKIFSDLKPGLQKIYNRILNLPAPDDQFMHQHFDKQKQWDFGIAILKKMGYDFDAGRQDISEHPFTTNFSSKDVRITTRIDENDFANMLWSCIHEGGHALYEQGLPEDQYGLPLAEYCSLSIHESQSRLWENNIGRGRAFWKNNFIALQNIFPEQLDRVSHESFYAAINKVQASLIRTEADEITYHFHVMIRYEIEKQLIENTIVAKDIPALWNELYRKYLNVEVPDDKHGCLQDVHWSHGSFGYFATYSLGSLYAAQLYNSMQKDIPSLNEYIATGNNQPVQTWLQQHVYKFGRQYNSAALCKLATGETLNSSHFLNYISKKYEDIYQFS